MELAGQPLRQLHVWVNTRGPATPLTLGPSTWSPRVWALAVSAVPVHFPFGHAALPLAVY